MAGKSRHDGHSLGSGINVALKHQVQQGAVKVDEAFKINSKALEIFCLNVKHNNKGSALNPYLLYLFKIDFKIEFK